MERSTRCAFFTSCTEFPAAAGSRQCRELIVAVSLLVVAASACGGSGSEARRGDSDAGAGNGDLMTDPHAVMPSDTAQYTPDVIEDGQEDGDGGGDEGDAGEEDTEEVANPTPVPATSPPTPEIARLFPTAQFGGERITIEGNDLTSRSERTGVWVGGVPASLVEVSRTRLVVTVPAELELSACETTLDLVVATGARQSAPVALTVKRRPPMIENAPMSWPAGSELSISGRGLGGAAVRIGGRELATSSASDTMIRLDLPRDLVTGAATVTVASDCGSSEADIEILFPIPRIRSIDPLTLAPGGVAYVRADFADRTMVRGVRVGNQRIAVDDAAHFAWPSHTEASTQDLLVVRMPSDLPVGPVSLTLESTSGETTPTIFEGVRDMGTHPPTDDQIRVPPGSAVSDGDGRFPIGTSESDPVLGTDGAHWCYALETGGISCREGRIYGHELLLPQGRSCLSYVYLSCRAPYDPGSPMSPMNPLACNLFEGRYRLDGSNNWVELFVTRGSNRERYVGGWVAPSGGPPAWVSRDGFDYFKNLLVLRSTRTGLQIVIEHDGSDTSCP